MAITNGYVDEARLQEYLRNQSIEFNSRADVALAIETASRDLEADGVCGRRFYADTVASARVYYADPRTPRCLEIDDAWEITGLTIDGVAVSLSDYDQWPLNGVVGGVEGWPTTRLELPRSGAQGSPFHGRCVVTAKWGWENVPKPVESACLALAAENLKAGEVPFGIGGLGPDGGVVRVQRLNPLVLAKLQPYRKGSSVVPIA